jgi:hypothetical protein
MNQRYSEPYFDDVLYSITGHTQWTKQDEIVWNQSTRQGDKHRFFQHAFEFISDNSIVGDYHEFGCHKCRTFRMALLESSRHFLDSMMFYAYDSFCGLPQAANNHGLEDKWSSGQLATSIGDFRKLIVSSGYTLDRVVEISGFYENTLPVLDLCGLLGSRKAALVTVDCDLYESAVSVFSYIDSILQEGSILYLDDYFTGYRGNPTKGVSRAFKEWLENSLWLAEPYRDVGWAGKSFVIYR